jgi:very-short-patch-repair endonuclease
MPAEAAKTFVQDGFLRSRGDDRWLAKLADEQYGVVGRRQLLERGLTDEAIEVRLRAGRLHRLHAGVYAVGHRMTSRKGQWVAAVLASGPEAALSHWSAAAFWMIRPNSRSIIDITTPQKSRSWDGIRRHHKALPTDEVTVEEGIPVTAVPRTILNLAATESADFVGNLLRESEYRQLRDRLSLWDLVERYPGKRGVRKVRTALERLREEPSGRRRSRLEERFAPFLRLHRLPQPRFNDWVFLGGRRFQVDCHWPGIGQIVELDGWEGHGTRTAFREDRVRDRALRVAGYSVTRLTWNQLDDEPELIASDLRVLLTANPLRARPHQPPPAE